MSVGTAGSGTRGCRSATGPGRAYWREEFAADERSRLEDEICVIQGEHFFVRARLVIPVHDAGEDFEWGIWTTLSRPNFARMLEVWDTPGREAERRTSAGSPPSCRSTRRARSISSSWCTPRRSGSVPHVLVEPTEHPLAVEQHRGITLARVRQIASLVQHAGA